MLECVALAKNENPDEMLHDEAFHKGLHYLLRQKIQFLFRDIYNGQSQVYCIKRS